MKRSALFTKILVLFLSTLMISCPKPEDDADKFVGTWRGTSMTKSVITTLYNQVSAIPYAKGLGSINATGGANAYLPYFNEYRFSVEEGLRISISSHATHDTSSAQRHSLNITVKPDDDEAYSYFVVLNGPQDYTRYFSNTVDYLFDSTSYLLTINSTHFYEGDEWWNPLDSNSFISVAGSLFRPTMQIEADSPTQVGEGFPIIYHFLNVKTDGSFKMESKYGYSSVYETEGVWEEEGDDLLLIQESEWGDQTSVLTLLDGKLAYREETDPCEMWSPEDLCLPWYEEVFMLDQGSLADLSEIQETVLSREEKQN